MQRFRARFRHALLVALPACAPARHAVGTSSSPPATSGSTASSAGTGSSSGLGFDLCASCYRLGMVCNVYDTACVTDCSQCMCTPVIAPVGPTDGGFADGGLPIDVCTGACRDPNLVTPGYPDLSWVVTGCFVLDAGCPPSRWGRRRQLRAVHGD